MKLLFAIMDTAVGNGYWSQPGSKHKHRRFTLSKACHPHVGRKATLRVSFREPSFRQGGASRQAELAFGTPFHGVMHKENEGRVLCVNAMKRRCDGAKLQYSTKSEIF